MFTWHFDVVVCNINREAIERLLKSLGKIMPEGILVASGWMASEFRSVQKVLRSCGLKITSWQFFNGWVGITAEKAKTLAFNRPS
ncbi:MAG: 50S ribosomal protein L11 methyltransferase [Candidatus Fervidibacter sp.]|uniref:50S ribosomal protein L11 methyltransferase n=1 Tax=Candidatus Fervidibacter sp. TaxID=3100871 RepID=UPI00404B2091